MPVSYKPARAASTARPFILAKYPMQQGKTAPCLKNARGTSVRAFCGWRHIIGASLFSRDRIGSVQPAPKVYIGTTARTEGPVFLITCLLADRATHCAPRNRSAKAIRSRLR